MSYLAPISKFESAPPDEEQLVDEMIEMFLRQMNKDLRKAKRDDRDALMLRPLHPKHHGCVEATFRVRDDIPKGYRKGIFQPGKKYKAWIRFSNSFPRPNSDTYPDGRGMAIKIMDVPGRKLLKGVFPDSKYSVQEKETQDFILVNSPIFFVPDARMTHIFLKLALSRNPVKILTFALCWPRLVWIVVKVFLKKTFNPLCIEYTSITPFLLGKEHAVKYSVAPVTRDGLRAPDPPVPKDSPHYLREAMARALDPENGEAAYFDFYAHVRRDEALSIEDATVLWTEERAPKLPLARITIEPQKFDTEERMSFAENLSFSVWNALPEHQPIGGINRIRLALYRATSEHRHVANDRRAFGAQPRET